MSNDVEAFELDGGGVARFDGRNMTVEISESGRFDDCGIFHADNRDEFDKLLSLARKGYLPGQGNDLGIVGE